MARMVAPSGHGRGRESAAAARGAGAAQCAQAGRHGLLHDGHGGHAELPQGEFGDSMELQQQRDGIVFAQELPAGLEETSDYCDQEMIGTVVLDKQMSAFVRKPKAQLHDTIVELNTLQEEKLQDKMLFDRAAVVDQREEGREDDKDEKAVQMVVRIWGAALCTLRGAEAAPPRAAARLEASQSLSRRRLRRYPAEAPQRGSGWRVAAAGASLQVGARAAAADKGATGCRAALLRCGVCLAEAIDVALLAVLGGAAHCHGAEPADATTERTGRPRLDRASLLLSHRPPHCPAKPSAADLASARGATALGLGIVTVAISRMAAWQLAVQARQRWEALPTGLRATSDFLRHPVRTDGAPSGDAHDVANADRQSVVQAAIGCSALLFGCQERWRGLCKALRGPVEHVALVNHFLPLDAQAQIKADRALRSHETIPLACRVEARPPGGADEEGDLLVSGAPEDMETERMPCYFLDGASVLAALALGARPGESVLDLCAAPGGKSLVLATAMFSGGGAGCAGGRLVCNEPSRPRAQRLQRVLSSSLPEALMGPAGRVSVTTADAASGSRPVAIERLGPYDRVLVDAPCTSDRHLAHQGAAALSSWAAGAVKANASRQLELLRTAASLVKPGGLVLYCTCALSEQENEGVIAKFLKRHQHAFETEPWEESDVAPSGDAAGPPTEAPGAAAGPAEGAAAASGPGFALPAGADLGAAGALILPDRSGFGPMYIARLRRRP
ncbi:unnamed protein product [Prorocentrum cordatum]|uniref:SAM-dependent MTase RsmB/NOP-type domain-containing protein n=1 Tax=Prorocentrum cordatum TaxID=2364126 RepID=A0ABN9PPM8_9DINO|nr:unnamed protein product [Polarella glacialis]